MTFIPSDPHSGFYFPPPANKDRAVNSMEIKDFIILWTYSQWRQAIVIIPPFLSRTGNVLHVFPYPNIQHSIFHLFSQENIPFILAIPMRLTVSKIWKKYVWFRIFLCCFSTYAWTDNRIDINLFYPRWMAIKNCSHPMAAVFISQIMQFPFLFCFLLPLPSHGHWNVWFPLPLPRKGR